MEMKYHVLYTVMTEEELSEYFVKMRDIVGGHVETTNWINRIEKGKESRTATYTTKFFICSNKGATSRCEVSMSRLKNHGTMKKEMRHFTLPELQNRHRQMVEDYKVKARKAVQLCSG